MALDENLARAADLLLRTSCQALFVEARLHFLRERFVSFFSDAKSWRLELVVLVKLLLFDFLLYCCLWLKALLASGRTPMTSSPALLTPHCLNRLLVHQNRPLLARRRRERIHVALVGD